MKKNNLINGDIVVLRSEEAPDAIMQVYRTNNGFGFSDYADDLPIYERDCSWVKPTEEEMAKKAEELKTAYIAEKEEKQKQIEKSRKDYISVVAQQFYGNKTKTTINTDEIDYFLLGILDSKDSIKEYPKVDRKYIKVPESHNVVIVYDQNQEDEYVNVKFPELYARESAEYKECWGEELKMQVSCEIPELNFKIHTRCFACRMDEKGGLQSLEPGDGKSFIKYFA